MKYTIELTLAGETRDITDPREDLVSVYGESEIIRVANHIGWDQLAEDLPTAFWVQVVDGDYEDIYCTFSSRPYSGYINVYKVTRKMEREEDPTQTTLQNISDQMDDTRAELHALCQVSNSFLLASLYRDLTAVADRIYKVAYPTKERN